MVDVQLLDETFDRDAATATAGDTGAGVGSSPGPDEPRVTLDVAPSARWVVETYPVEEVDDPDDGWLRVRLAVTATPWLERLLVRLGRRRPGGGGRRPRPGATPAPCRTAGILARYGAAEPGPLHRPACRLR